MGFEPTSPDSQSGILPIELLSTYLRGALMNSYRYAATLNRYSKVAPKPILKENERATNPFHCINILGMFQVSLL